MENVIAIGAGLALRALIDNLTDSDYRLTSTLIGLWEGIVLSHFLQKDPRNSSDAYLALATRFAIDFLFTTSVVRFALTGAWTVVGLLLSDVAPSVWRGTGLRNVYKALKKEFKAMRRAVPRWRIENNIKVPSISISSPLFSRPPPSTVVSSTRAAPPTSPAPILVGRPPSSTPASQVTSSSRTNPLTREVLPGPSPVLISTAVDPRSFHPDPHSHRTSLLSDSHESDPSRLNPILIPDDDRVHVILPSSPEEQVQEQDPELSVLDISPPVPEVEVTTVNLEIISPTPLASIRALPTISDIDISVVPHQVPLPPSHPASRITAANATVEWRGNVRAFADKIGSDLGPEFGKAYHQRSSSAGVLGSGKIVYNRSSSTGHQRIESSSGRRERSMLSEESWRRGVVEPIGNDRVRTEPGLSSAPETEPFVGGFFIQAGRQTPQHSGTPQVQSGTGDIRPKSVLGLTISHPSSKGPTPPPKSRSTTPVPPPIKPPTPAYQAQQTTSVPHPKSDNIPPEKAPTPAPVSRSKANTPQPKSDSATSDPISGTNRATDYNPAEPIRPMIASPSTVHDSIFGGAPHRAYATADFDTTERDIDESPPPEYESPMDAHGEGFGVTRGEGSGEGAVTGGGVNDEQKGEKQKIVADKNIGDVGLGVQAEGEGEHGQGETSQGPGGCTQAAPENITKPEENTQENLGDNQEQGMSKQEMKINEGAGGDGQGAGDDTRTTDNVAQPADEGLPVADGDTQIASGDTQVPVSTEDPDKKSTPVSLTPEQTEAEAHRITFLRETVLQLELQASKLKPEETALLEIQARVDLLKERISRTNFIDPPDHPPLTPELLTTGRTIPDILEQLKTKIVDSLIERQDAGPIQVKVSKAAKKKQKDVDKTLKEFINKTGFSISSDTDGLVTIITA